MNHFHKSRMISFVAGLLCLISSLSEANAQFTIDWYKIAGGGGEMSGAEYDLQGTIGQHDASQELTGGTFSLSGGLWTSGDSSGGVFQVVADSVNVTRGTLASGGVTELATSDNNDLTIQRANSDVQSRTEFQVKAISPIVSPVSLEVSLEGAVFARSVVSQTIELFDYQQNQWEVVDTRTARRFTDLTVTIPATGDLSRFVEPVTNFAWSSATLPMIPATLGPNSWPIRPAFMVPM